MNESGRNCVRNKILLVLSNIFCDSGVNADMLEYIDLVDDLGMDSIRFISMIIEIETEFNIQIPEEWLIMERFQTCKTIIDTICHILNENDVGENNT